MLNKELQNVIKAIADDITSIVRSVMESDVGVNAKVGINTLKDSDLIRSLKVVATNDGDLIYDISLNAYIEFVESGRRAGAKFPPVKPIADWYRKKFGKEPSNSTIFLIRRSISENGIKARPIFATVFNITDKQFDNKWSDSIYDAIITAVNDFFND